MLKKWKVLLIILALLLLFFCFLVYRYGFQHLIIIFHRIWYLVFKLQRRGHGNQINFVGLRRLPMKKIKQL